MLDNWNSVFRNTLKPDIRNYVSLAFMQAPVLSALSLGAS